MAAQQTPAIGHQMPNGNDQSVGTNSLDRYAENSLAGQTIRIIDNPTDWGKPRIGAQDGPGHVKAVGGIERHLVQAGATVVHGSVPVPRREHTDTTTVAADEQLRNVDEMLSAGREGGAQIRAALQSGEKVLALRGDHSGALDLVGALQAFPDPKDPEFSALKIIWIDTHPDINGVSASLNGHGKMVRTLLGEGHPDLAKIMESIPKLRPENIIYVGLSQPDNAEIESLKRLKITCFTSDDLEDKKEEMYRTINEFVSSGNPCWLEFDQDSMGDTVSRGTFMPNGDEGLTPREVYSIARRFYFGGNGVGIGIAEVVPTLDKDGQSAKIATGLASRALGAGNPLYNHGGYDTDAESSAASTERAEIAGLIRGLKMEVQEDLEKDRSQWRELEFKVNGLKRFDRRALLRLAIVIGLAKLGGDVVQNNRRPALLDEAVFRCAVIDFKKAIHDGNFEERESANSTIQSMVHLALYHAHDDDGLKAGIWNAVRRELGDNFDAFQKGYRNRYRSD